MCSAYDGISQSPRDSHVITDGEKGLHDAVQVVMFCLTLIMQAVHFIALSSYPINLSLVLFFSAWLEKILCSNIKMRAMRLKLPLPMHRTLPLTVFHPTRFVLRIQCQPRLKNSSTIGITAHFLAVNLAQNTMTVTEWINFYIVWMTCSKIFQGSIYLRHLEKPAAKGPKAMQQRWTRILRAMYLHFSLLCSVTTMF